MLDNVPFSDWPAAAFALVGRSDLAEMAAAAERSAAESRRAAAAAPVQALSSLQVAGLTLRAERSGHGRAAPLTPMWQPQLRTPAPGQQ